MKFSKSAKSWVVLLLFVACCAQLTESAFLKKFTSGLKSLFKKSSKPIEYIKHYNEINDYLSKNSPADESIDESLSRVEKWRSELKPQSCFSGSSKRLQEAIDQFLGLKKLTREGQLCSPLSGKILDANDDSTSDSTLKIMQNGLQDARRVDKIVFELANQHINTCPAKLGELFHARYEKVPAGVRGPVEHVQEKILCAHLVDDAYHSDHLDPAHPEQFIEKYPVETAMFIGEKMRNVGDHIHDLKIVFEHLDDESKKTKDSNNYYLHKLSAFDKADRDKLDALYQRYLINPCIDYVNFLEAIFSPLEFDFEFIEPLSVFPIINNPANAKLMHSFVHYQACEKLIQDKSVLFKDFVKYVDWRLGQLEFTE